MRMRRIKLIEARKKMNLTQKEMAKKIGVTLRMYQSYEYCQHEMSLRRAEHIAVLTNITLEDLTMRNITA